MADNLRQSFEQASEFFDIVEAACEHAMACGLGGGVVMGDDLVAKFEIVNGGQTASVSVMTKEQWDKAVLMSKLTSNLCLN